MAINNAKWVGPANTQEYIRQLEEELTKLRLAIQALGGKV